jgi:TRAP-type C4-dicarboxylate transport system permease large subunit
VILLVAIIYLILGMFIDAIGLMLLTLPIVVPIAGSAGIDLIWFGVILIKLLEMGLVTPPVGLNVYVVKSSLGNLVSLSQVFRGVWWFLVMDVIVLVIIFFWPETTLYMPKLIFG